MEEAPGSPFIGPRQVLRIAPGEVQRTPLSTRNTSAGPPCIQDHPGHGAPEEGFVRIPANKWN